MPIKRNSFFDHSAVRILCTFLYLMTIYGSLAYVRDIVNYLYKRVDLSLTIYIFYAALLVPLTILAYRCFQKRIRPYLFICGLIFIYAYSMREIQAPSERIHFLQYGLLTLLTLWAVNPQLSGRFNYIATLLFVTIAGWVDEIIQYFLPMRFYDTRDIFLNTYSCILALAMINIFCTYSKKIAGSSANEPATS